MLSVIAKLYKNLYFRVFISGIIGSLIFLSLRKSFLNFSLLNIESANFNKAIYIFLVSFTLTGFCLLVLSYCWAICVKSISLRKFTKSKLMSVYLFSNAGKYLPGNIFNFIGRSIVLYRDGSRQSILQANMVEILVSVFINALMLLLSMISLIALFGWPSPLNTYGISNRISLILLLILVFFLYHFQKLLLKILLKKEDSTKIKLSSAILFRMQLLTSLVYCVEGIFFGYCLIYLSPDHHVKAGEVLYSITVYGGAALIGFLTPGIPSGIGVKEGVVLLFLKSLYPISALVLALLVIRLSSIIADIVLFIAAKFYLKGL